MSLALVLLEEKLFTWTHTGTLQSEAIFNILIFKYIKGQG